MAPGRSLELLEIALLIPFTADLNILLGKPNLFSPVSSFMVFLYKKLSPMPAKIPVPVTLPTFPNPEKMLFPDDEPIALLIVPTKSPFRSIFSTL